MSMVNTEIAGWLALHVPMARQFSDMSWLYSSQSLAANA
jgi:hypothetical protein